MRITVDNPLGRVPVSMILDDSCPVVNLSHFWIKLRQQSGRAGGTEHNPDEMPVEIPEAFARKFGEWCGENGVKGKFSYVPMPGGLGTIDLGLPGFSKAHLDSWIKMTDVPGIAGGIFALFQADNDDVYLGGWTWKDCIYKSTDNGQSWTLKRQGIEGRQPFAWRLARTTEGTLYLVVARRSDRGEIGNQDDGALYRSTDGAENWERVGLPQGTNGPNGIAIDPRDSRRLYLAAWTRSPGSI